MPASIARLIRSLVAGSSEPVTDQPDAVIRLVYARTDAEASEPLVAVCRTEPEARVLEQEVLEVGSGAEVRWETHDVLGIAGDEVYAVMQAPDLSQEPLTELDPVGLKVFARKDEAERYAAQRRKQFGVDHFIVWSLPIGWRRPGWPFDRTTAAP